MAVAGMERTTMRGMDGQEWEVGEGLLVRHETGGVGRTYGPTSWGCVAVGAVGTRERVAWRVDECQAITMAAPVDREEPCLVDRVQRLRRTLKRLVQGEKGHRTAQSQLANWLYLTQYGEAGSRWFWQTVAESVTDPRKISFAPTLDAVDDNDRRRYCSVARFLRGPAKRHGLNLSEEVIREIAQLFGSQVAGHRDWEFELLTGREVVEAYREVESFAHSCMSGSHCGKTWLYAVNPEKVALVKILRGGQWVGRALLWTTDQGPKVLDRVYPSDQGPQMMAAHEWARSNGWDYKIDQDSSAAGLASERRDYRITLRTDGVSEWPYIDTFKFTDDDPDDDCEITLKMTPGCVEFEQTDGTHSGSEYRYSCDECDRRIDEDDAQTNDNGITYCQGCYDERYVSLDYRHGGRSVNEEANRDEVEDCAHCGETRYEAHLTEVEGTGGDRYCEECLSDHTVSCVECGDYWLRGVMDTDADGDRVCEGCGDRCETCGDWKVVGIECCPPDEEEAEEDEAEVEAMMGTTKEEVTA